MRALPLVLIAGCASSAPPPAPTVPTETPDSPASSSPLDEAECSAAFPHAFVVGGGDAQMLTLIGDVRADFILTCVQEFDRAKHFDCTVRAQDKASLDACQRPPLSRHT